MARASTTRRAAGVAARSRLAAQLGGAAGTLASLGEHGARRCRRRSRTSSGWPSRVLPWHTERGRIAELAGGARRVRAGAVAKVARRRRAAAQTEVGEVRERSAAAARPRCRTSTTRWRAISALGCARQAPGLAASLLAAAWSHEHERAAGAWHAEWAPLRELLAASALGRGLAARVPRRLEVDTDRMRANLDPLVFAERVATALAGSVGREQANALVAEAVRAGEFPGALRDRVPDLDALLDPAGAVGSAGALVDRFLAARPR